MGQYSLTPMLRDEDIKSGSPLYSCGGDYRAGKPDLHLWRRPTSHRRGRVGHMRLPFHCRKSSEGILFIAETDESRHHLGILFHHGSENAATFLVNLFRF